MTIIAARPTDQPTNAVTNPNNPEKDHNMTTNIALAPASSTNRFTGASGNDILAAIVKGKRSPDAFIAACDEVDRRVSNRNLRGLPVTKPIAECVAILAKRKVAIATPDNGTMDYREKDGPTDIAPTVEEVKVTLATVERELTKSRVAKAKVAVAAAGATDEVKAMKAEHVNRRKAAREWATEEYKAWKAGDRPDRDKAPTTDEAYTKFDTFRARPVSA